MSFPQIGLEALLKDAAFNQGVKGFMGSVDRMTDKSVSGAGAISRAFAGMGKAGLLVAASAVAAVGAAAVGAAAYLRSAIGPASDLAETISKVGIVFGSEGTAVLKWSENSAKAMGMTRNDALAAAGTYGNLFRAMGMTETASSDMSMELIELASDLASFNNMDPKEVLEKLRAGLTGESEPLKTLGVNINETIIKEEALTAGIWDGTGALTAAQKATASYRLIMRQTSLAQGDFARTSGGLANQQRILAATMANLKAKIGTALLPAITGITAKISEMANSPAFGQFIDKIGVGLGNVATWITNDFVPGIGEAISRISTFIADIANGDSLAGSIRVLLAGVFDEGKVEGLIDVVKWVQAVYRAVEAGDWTTVGTMLWTQVTESVGKAMATLGGIDTMIRDSLSGKLGISKELQITPGMEGLPSDVLAAMQPNTSTWGEIGAALGVILAEQFGVAKEYLAGWLAKGVNFGTRIYEGMKQGLLDALNVKPLFEMSATGEWVDASMWGAVGQAIGTKLQEAIVAGLRAAFDAALYGIPEAIHDWAKVSTEKFRTGGELIGETIAGMIADGVGKEAETNEWGDSLAKELVTALGAAIGRSTVDVGNMGIALAEGLGIGFTNWIKGDAWRAGISAALGEAFKAIMSAGPFGWAIRLAGGWDALMGLKDVIPGTPPAGIIGGRAAGGWASGLTKVGERGPELVNLPAGSFVHSNAESQRMSMAAIGGTTVYDIRVNIGGGTSAQVRQSAKIGVLEGLSAKGVR